MSECGFTMEREKKAMNLVSTLLCGFVSVVVIYGAMNYVKCEMRQIKKKGHFANLSLMATIWKRSAHMLQFHTCWFWEFFNFFYLHFVIPFSLERDHFP